MLERQIDPVALSFFENFQKTFAKPLDKSVYMVYNMYST